MPGEAGPLLEQLRRDAAATRAARLEAGRATADRLLSAAAMQRGHRRAGAVEAREHALTRQRDAARADAEQETKRGVFTARAAFLDRVFAAAERRLQALEHAPDLEHRLVPLLAEALPFVDPADARVRCSSTARVAVTAALTALERADTPVLVDDAVPLGALIENGDDTVRVDATFGARLRRLRPTLSIEAVQLIEASVT